MVSLVKLSQVTEEGVQFQSPYSSSASKHIPKSAFCNLEMERNFSNQTNAGPPSAHKTEIRTANDSEPEEPADLMMLTPEKSMEIQNAIGADIMMQLDDVVSSTTTGPRVQEAMFRYVSRYLPLH